MASGDFGFLRVKGVALGTRDVERARAFYRDTLGLAPRHEGETLLGYMLGDTVIMPKADWHPPTDDPNPRITVEVEDAPATEAALRAKGVEIADPVQPEGEHHFGSFLDSEGNKIWFCS